MDKIRKIVLLLGVYLLIFWIGFKVGEAKHRMTSDMEEKKERLVQERLVQEYYIVEKNNCGNCSSVSFQHANENSSIMRFYLNPKLRSLLKLGDVQIYTPEGKRIY